MTAQKPSQVAVRPSPAPAGGNPSPRKPWRKRTPIDVILDQIAKVREDVEGREKELAQAKRQLAKLEEVRKTLESA